MKEEPVIEIRNYDGYKNGPHRIHHVYVNDHLIGWVQRDDGRFGYAYGHHILVSNHSSECLIPYSPWYWMSEANNGAGYMTETDPEKAMCHVLFWAQIFKNFLIDQESLPSCRDLIECLAFEREVLDARQSTVFELQN